MNKSSMSTLLTIIGSAGVVATAITAVKNSSKAHLLIDAAERERHEPLGTIDKIKVAAPAYIPTVIVGASTIACIFGSNILNKRSQASLISAYALLDASYKEYRKKVEDIYGEGSDESIIAEIAKDNYDTQEELPDDEQLFFDHNSMQYFTARIEDVVQKTTMDDGLEVYIIATPFDTPRIW